jgi:hypothetical protein
MLGKRTEEYWTEDGRILKKRKNIGQKNSRILDKRIGEYWTEE